MLHKHFLLLLMLVGWGYAAEPFKVQNDTFDMLQRISQSHMSRGNIELSVTTHQDLGWVDDVSTCEVLRDTLWLTPFLDRLADDPCFAIDIEQTTIIKEYLARHPERYKQIIQGLHHGRILIGAAYIQPYEELYFSESLARMFYLGKLWMKNNLDGYESTTYYNSDVPGRTLQMPQLLARSGVENMFISRHGRGVFDWRSPDGSTVTVYSPGHYIDFYDILAKDNPHAVKALAEQVLFWSQGYNDVLGEKAVIPAILNYEFIWDQKPVQNLDPFIALWNGLEIVENDKGQTAKVQLPQFRFSTLDTFFNRIRQTSQSLPVIQGERPNVWIYIHGPSHHRAISQSRRADILLPAAEKFAAALAWVENSYARYPQGLLDQAWQSKIYPDQGGLKNIFDKQFQMEVIDAEFFKAGEIFTMESKGNGAGGFEDVQQPTLEGFDRTGLYPAPWTITAADPVFHEFRSCLPIRDAVVELTVRFFETIKRIDFDVALKNWRGVMFREFRLAIPVNIENAQLAYEVPFGVVQIGQDEIHGPAGERHTTDCRTVHPRGISNWISASGKDFGVTLSSCVAVVDYIDPTDQHLKNTVLQPILLASRKSCHPEGNEYHQTGRHDYSFSLTSHPTGWKNGFRFGAEANEPLFAVVNPTPYAHTCLNPSQSFVTVNAPNVILSAMKKAEADDSLVLRLYELFGEDTDVKLTLFRPFAWGSYTNLIEEEKSPLAVDQVHVNLQLGHHAIETVKLK